MLVELEQIVQLYSPFVGTHEVAGFDEKSRITIPKPLIEILQERQKIEEKGAIKLYYRIHSKETPQHLELTDYFPDGEHTEFWAYNRIKIDRSGRILVPQDNLAKLGIQKHDPSAKSKDIIFEGSGHKILIYKTDDYPRDT